MLLNNLLKVFLLRLVIFYFIASPFISQVSIIIVLNVAIYTVRQIRYSQLCIDSYIVMSGRNKPSILTKGIGAHLSLPGLEAGARAAAIIALNSQKYSLIIQVKHWLNPTRLNLRPRSFHSNQLKTCFRPNGIVKIVKMELLFANGQRQRNTSMPILFALKCQAFYQMCRFPHYIMDLKYIIVRSVNFVDCFHYKEDAICKQDHACRCFILVNWTSLCKTSKRSIISFLRDDVNKY